MKWMAVIAATTTRIRSASRPSAQASADSRCRRRKARPASQPSSAISPSGSADGERSHDHTGHAHEQVAGVAERVVEGAARAPPAAVAVLGQQAHGHDRVVGPQPQVAQLRRAGR